LPRSRLEGQRLKLQALTSLGLATGIKSGLATAGGRRTLLIVPGSSIKPSRHMSRRERRQKKHAAFRWTIGAVFLTVAIVGLIWLLYQGQRF